MGYETLLRLSLIPTCTLFILSLVSIILHAHYWILGDWILAKWLKVILPDRSSVDIILDYVGEPTDATITGQTLSLAAGVMAFVAWYKLRRSDMDMNYNDTRRRFYTGFTIFLALAGFCSALAGLILHFTKLGDGDDYDGCSSQFRETEFWIVWCTREKGACNVSKKWQDGTDKAWSANIACSEALAVKWLLLPVMLCNVLVIVMFAAQAWSRKKTRYQRVPKHGQEKLASYE
ncbi:hypothetical protein EJ04DRAFT_569334 [Polyplosphaeria fusca]|uniref:Uncharacterized protein n=1 Tax=Polyplosphaeria fusca TaxID=682080 RepID=A0A9P4QPS0_9PLEO|nr:hypothetical protein EJ04DRAFT_569334 [Polyplosphaeria fusca]